MAGNWSGRGTVTLDDGSSERIRCRATYKVGGANMDMSLTCASDAYRFNLLAAVVARRRRRSPAPGARPAVMSAAACRAAAANGSFQVVAERGRFQRQHLAEDHRQQAVRSP